MSPSTTHLRGAAAAVAVAAIGAGVAIGAVAIGCEPPVVETLEDMEFLAFVDVDGNGLSYDDAPTTIRLSDYFAVNRPGTRVIMINAAAGWCDPCSREAGDLPDFAATYEPRGVAILTAVFENNTGDPADETFTGLWAETYALPIPVLIDTAFATGRYFDAGAMPANMFVDAETLEILSIETGAAPGDDPLQEYRDFLDAYLAE